MREAGCWVGQALVCMWGAMGDLGSEKSEVGQWGASLEQRVLVAGGTVEPEAPGLHGQIAGVPGYSRRIEPTCHSHRVGIIFSNSAFIP